LGSKADISQCHRNVRFTPESGMVGLFDESSTTAFLEVRVPVVAIANFINRFSQTMPICNDRQRKSVRASL
jgi:hypothetical protein